MRSFVYDAGGKPSFQNIQNYRNTDKYPIQFILFDIVELEGKNLTSLPLHLLNARAVNKGTNAEGQKFNAWLQLDFSQKDDK